jgi:hypothetical protein
MNSTKLGAASTIFTLWASASAAPLVSPGDAGTHVGETATVCGVVASAKFLANSHAQPTLLDLDKPYPDAVFTAVVFGDDRAKFGTPETSLRGKRICVTGQIRDYHGKPEIILNDPSQLSR